MGKRRIPNALAIPLRLEFALSHPHFALFFILAPALLAQAPDAQVRLDLALQVMEAYGAKARFSAGLQGQLQSLKAQQPAPPAAELDAFARELMKDAFYERLARPFADTFSAEELRALLGHFRSPGCQKAFNAPASGPGLNPEEQQDVERFRSSAVGVRFSQAWPGLKQELSEIGREWVLEAMARARRTPNRKSGHH